MTQARELSLRQQLFFAFLACFLVGILVANLLGADLFEENGSLTRYYLKQFQYTAVNSQELLWHVCENRLTLFLVLLALGNLSKHKLIHAAFTAWSGFAFGYFCVMALGGFGAKGLLLCLAALLPQFLLYVPVYLGLVELSERRRERKRLRYLLAALLLFGGLFVGMLLESYANPVILQKILKIL